MKPTSLFLALLVAISARANLDGPKWIFHLPARDYAFEWSSAFRGTPMISLGDLVQTFRLIGEFNPQEFKVTLTNPKNKSQVSFYTFSKAVTGTNFSLTLSRRPEFEGAKLHVPVDFGDRALRPLLTGEKPVDPALSFSESTVDVVVDPGHGGNDFGTTLTLEDSKTFKEKDFTLEFSTALAEGLNKKGLKVALTRDRDYFLSLPERTSLANKLKAKLFLSIHLNSEASKALKGSEIYLLSLENADSAGRAAVARENQSIPDDMSEGTERALSDLKAEANFERSLAFAKVLWASMKTQSSIPSKQAVRTGAFYVLYGADMPAALIELGYLTSPEDRLFIMNPKRHRALIEDLSLSLANAIKKGIN